MMIVLFLLVFCALNTYGVKEGDYCIKEGLVGACTNIRYCPAAQQDIKDRKQPQLCEFPGLDPIVCCVSSGTTITQRPQKRRCVLPPYPESGTYSANVANGRPGEAYDIVVMNITCNRGYKLDGHKTIFCQDGWWPEEMPKCVHTGCKKRDVHGFGYKPVIRVDDEGLEHVTLRRDSNGGLEYFEMHIKIKGVQDGIILLSELPDPTIDDFYYDIVAGGSQNVATRIRVRTLHLDKYVEGVDLKETKTPGLLSRDDFRAFYVKIDSGTLEFGREGDSWPIVSQFDEKLRLIKYISFSSWAQTDVSFLYDC